MMRFDNIVSLPSGNTARGFSVRDLGNGRARIQYVYTDRRRAHQVARHFTVEFLNGRVESIIARSARGGRVETFKTSTILSVLLEMVAEVNKVNEALSNFRKDAAEMETTETPVKGETNEQAEPESARIAFNPSVVLSIALFLIAVVGVVVCGITDNDVIAQVAAGVSFCSLVCAVICSARFHA